jgi:hypothetical protein
MINLSNIPDELKQLNQWVCWIKHPERGKVPITPLTTSWAKSNDPSTWRSFAAAVRGLTKTDGLGFMLTPPYVGIDIDDSLDMTIPDRVQSYTELSPSGNGLHTLVKGEIPKAFKKDGLEIYQTQRFLTVTGEVVNNLKEIKNCNESLKGIIQEHFGEVTSRNPVGWISETLRTLKKGQICNLSVKIIGRLHRDGWGKEDIATLLMPHIERVGGDTKMLEQRINSITQYANKSSLSPNDSSEVSTDIEDFLESGNTETTWLVNNIIGTGTISIIAGLGGTRKTWILTDLAIEMAKGGGYWLGKFPVMDGKVLYIDQERPAVETRRRFSRVMAGKNLNPRLLKDNLQIMSGTSITLNLERSFEAFRKKLQVLKPTLVLVDSLITFHSNEDNSRSEMQAVFERVKQLRNEFECAFVFLDHESKAVLGEGKKDEEPNAHDTSGSAGKIAACETVLTVRGKDSTTSAVYHTKSNLGPTVEPFLVTVTDEGENKTYVKGY